MPFQLFAGLVLFAAATAWTPGPNNLMLLTSGVNFGLARTLPHMAGINVGFPVMIVIVGIGIGQLFTTYPLIYTTLKVIGILYTLWLAWKIANAGPMKKEAAAASRPMRFHEALLFQWVNPKAWAMALTAVSTYTLAGDYLFTLFAIAATYFVVNLPGSFAWTGFGIGLRNLLHDERRVHIFNITMAVLLVASLVPVLLESR